MGPERAADLLAAGCNDMGGSIMNESITKAAGVRRAVVPVLVLTAPLGQIPPDVSTAQGKPRTMHVRLLLGHV